MMSVNRGGFLRAILGGIAAAPVVPAVLTAGTKEKGEVKPEPGISVTRWEHDGIKFAKWIMPIHVPPMFEADNPAVSYLEKGMPLGDGKELTRRFYAPRRYVVAIFDRSAGNAVGRSLENLVEAVVDSYLRTVPVERFGKRMQEEGEDGKLEGKSCRRSKPAHVVVVEVVERPNLLGLMVADEELVPVRDFYRTSSRPEYRLPERI
jgi:hypothetical protein